jgi:hypothetical protein
MIYNPDNYNNENNSSNSNESFNKISYDKPSDALNRNRKHLTPLGVIALVGAIMVAGFLIISILIFALNPKQWYLLKFRVSNVALIHTLESRYPDSEFRVSYKYNYSDFVGFDVEGWRKSDPDTVYDFTAYAETLSYCEVTDEYYATYEPYTEMSDELDSIIKSINTNMSLYYLDFDAINIERESTEGYTAWASVQFDSTDIETAYDDVQNFIDVFGEESTWQDREYLDVDTYTDHLSSMTIDIYYNGRYEIYSLSEFSKASSMYQTKSQFLKDFEENSYIDYRYTD